MEKKKRKKLSNVIKLKGGNKEFGPYFIQSKKVIYFFRR